MAKRKGKEEGLTIQRVEAMKPGDTIKSSVVRGMVCRMRKGEDRTYSIVYRVGQRSGARDHRCAWSPVDTDDGGGARLADLGCGTRRPQHATGEARSTCCAEG